MNRTVGYTNDGKVFMKIGHVSDGGEPLETTILWDPREAEEMGQFLITAAEEALKGLKENDSTTTDRGRT